MPSLHVALPAAAAFWYGWGRPAGKALFAYSALIAVTVMYTGDHYLADIAAGYGLAACVFLAVRRLRWPLLRDAGVTKSERSVGAVGDAQQRIAA